MTLKQYAPAIAAIVLAMPAPATANKDHHFRLHGGFFYGPGPVKPDTALPDGDIAGIAFDVAQWRGTASFKPADKLLSDGTTRVNANIDAGRLVIGENKQAKTFWLTAVDGGPHQGTETYTFDDSLNFVWQVDLALDPGFAEGIIRVDNFKLTTGWVQVPRSVQSTNGIPGGYDRAGSLPSGSFLVGRVGDFDRDGYLDGVLVASASVPLESDMLPGAPVGNLRGFVTDIPVEPLTAAEMTLAGVQNMQPVIDQLMAAGDLPKLKDMLADIGDRIDAASLNCEDAFLKGDRARKDALQEIRWRIDAARKLFFIPWAFLSHYEYPAGKPSESIQDSTRRGFEIVADILPRLKALRVPATETTREHN
jgi:hypothetical protein